MRTGPFASSSSSRANRSSDSFGSLAGSLRLQTLQTALTPVPAPLLDRRLAHPQVFGDLRRSVTALEPPAGFHPDPFPRSPPLGSQAPTIRIPNNTGIPHGSPNVTTRTQPEELSNQKARRSPGFAVKDAYGDPRREEASRRLCLSDGLG